MTTPRPSANAPSRRRQSTHPHADEPLLVGWVVGAPEPEDDGDDDDEPHGTHAHAHAYEHLLVGWIVDFAAAGEGGGGEGRERTPPNDTAPRLRAPARRVVRVCSIGEGGGRRRPQHAPPTTASTCSQGGTGANSYVTPSTTRIGKRREGGDHREATGGRETGRRQPPARTCPLAHIRPPRVYAPAVSLMQ
jgi:hypothetical protein